MARELYNWDQGKGYSVVALQNLIEKAKEKNIEITIENYIKEYDSLQTMYGKEGIVGLAQRYLKKEREK